TVEHRVEQYARELAPAARVIPGRRALQLVCGRLAGRGERDRRREPTGVRGVRGVELAGLDGRDQALRHEPAPTPAGRTRDQILLLGPLARDVGLVVREP